MIFQRRVALLRQGRNQIANRRSHTSHDLHAGRAAEAYLLKSQPQPVKAIMPDVIKERNVNATALFTEDVTVRNLCSSLGRIIPAGTALAA
jgi:hypothetical protein